MPNRTAVCGKIVRKLAMKHLKPFGFWRTGIIGAVCGCALLAACLAGSPQALAGGKAATPVILISIDTLRADRLGCYGNRRPLTPHLDEIARGGTLFEQAASQAPLTLPSHTALLTSTFPFSSGVEDNGVVVAGGKVTLQSVLKASGYRTAAFVGGFVLDRRFGLNQGFDTYDSPFDAQLQAGHDPGDIKRDGAQVVDSASAWLRQNSAQPFFLFIHLYDLHTPYTTPAGFRPAQKAAGYDAALGYVDSVVGRLWATLKDDGLLDRSLIVFTADHGESLGDHGEATHGYFIYQSTLHVPLIIHWPASASTSPFRARVQAAAGLVDVAPTVLQFLGLPMPPAFQGKSLLSLAAGRDEAARAVYSESLYAQNHFDCAALECLRVGHYKFIQAPRPELYDLAADPHEAHNLYQQQKPLARTLQEQLLRFRSRYGVKPQTSNSGLSPDAIARLSSLGYVAVSGPLASARTAGADPKDRIGEYEEYGRALILENEGKLQPSSALLHQVLDRIPDLPDVRNALGILDQRLGKQQEAASEFRTILAQHPALAMAHFNLAVSEYALGQPALAVRELQATLAIDPAYSRAMELLGAIWLAERQYPRARAQFEKLLQQWPRDFAALTNLGVLDSMQGDWKQAEAHFVAALSVNPNSADARNALGSVFLHQGRLAEAQRELTKAIALQPRFAWAHYNLGLALEREDNLGGAQQEFQRALAADPGFAPARQALQNPAAPAR